MRAPAGMMQAQRLRGRQALVSSAVGDLRPSTSTELNNAGTRLPFIYFTSHIVLIYSIRIKETAMLDAPSKLCRDGIALTELAEMFPNESAARKWFEELRWPNSSYVCPHCGSDEISTIESARPMPFRCKKCRKHFSVKTGSVMEKSKVKLQKWAFAIHLCVTSAQGTSSMKLHRDLGVTQKTAWLMAHRIREAFEGPHDLFSEPVEVDESYIGSVNNPCGTQ